MKCIHLGHVMVIVCSELADLVPDGKRELILDEGHHPCGTSDTSANRPLDLDG